MIMCLIVVLDAERGRIGVCKQNPLVYEVC